MFNGHHTIEHEEDVVRIVFILVKKNRKFVKILSLKNSFFFFSKAIACWLLANIASLCSKYASSKEYFFAFCFSHIHR